MPPRIHQGRDLTNAESAAVRESLAAVTARESLCFSNAFRVAVFLRYRGLPAHYAEGIAVARTSVYNHAWVTLGGGSVIDPTWEDGARLYVPAAVLDPKDVSRPGMAMAGLASWRLKRFGPLSRADIGIVIPLGVSRPEPEPWKPEPTPRHEF